ncbi:hypothetical protein CerSpe_171030 [Prunus speciosa]
MAKTGVFDSDPAMVAKATELKKEMQRLVRTIVGDEDFSTQTIDQAKTQILLFIPESAHYSRGSKQSVILNLRF